MSPSKNKGEITWYMCGGNHFATVCYHKDTDSNVASASSKRSHRTFVKSRADTLYVNVVSIHEFTQHVHVHVYEPHP